jgi:hypothetical protein
VTPLEALATACMVVVLVLLATRPPVGIAALALMYPLYDQVPRMPLPGMNAETTVIGFALALTLMRFGVRLPPLRYSLPVVALVVLMLGSWAIGSALALKVLPGADPWDFFRVVKSLMFTSVLFIVGYWWLSERRDRTRVLEAMSMAIGVCAVSGILDQIFGWYPSARMGRVAGLLGNPHSLALALGAFSLVSL